METDVGDSPASFFLRMDSVRYSPCYVMQGASLEVTLCAWDNKIWRQRDMGWIHICFFFSHALYEVGK